MTKRQYKLYPDDFKHETIVLVTEQGYLVVEASASVRITDKFLYKMDGKA
jgi:transposase-like protein